MWKHQLVGPGAGRSALEWPVLRGGQPKAYVFKTANNQETIVHSNLSGNIFVCVCVCVCVDVLASNLAMVTQHKWAACPFLSAGVSSSSQGPRRGMEQEQMVWGCSKIPVPRAVSSPVTALWHGERAEDQRGLCKEGGSEQLLGILMVSAFGWMLRRSRNGNLWGIVGSTEFCVKPSLPKSKGVRSSDAEGTLREAMLVLLGKGLRAFSK